MTCLSFSQGSQRLCDGWHSTFSSAAIAIVNAFFDDHLDYSDSNDMRQEFATHMLNHLRFAYHQAQGNDPKVILGQFVICTS